MLQPFLETIPNLLIRKVEAILIPSEKLFERLETHHLPSLDQVLVELIEACGEEEVGFDRLSQIISKDVALSTKVLMVINSPLYAQTEKITRLQQALIVMGVETIKIIGLTAAYRQVLSEFNVDEVIDLRHFWRRSLHCALTMKSLAKLTGYGLNDEAYLAGLLHNLGELVIASNFPAESRYLKGGDQDTRPQLEKKQFGFTSVDVGAWLIEQWRMKSYIADAVRYQNEALEQIREAHELIKMLYLAIRFFPVRDDSALDQQGFELAEELFGLTAAVVREMLGKVDEQLSTMTQSLGIERGPVRSAAAGEELQPTFYGIAAGRPGLSPLVELVREKALLESTLPLLNAAEATDDVYAALGSVLLIIFGVRQLAFFLPDNDKKRLIGRGTDPDDPYLKRIHIACDSSTSVIADAYQTGSPRQFSLTEGNEKGGITDKQIIHHFGTEGMLCMPLKIGEDVSGVLVILANGYHLDRLNRQRSLLGEVSSATAKSLVCIKTKRDQDLSASEREVDSERFRKLMHEVNNPLGIMKNYISILSGTLGGEHGKELAVLSEEIERIGRLMRRYHDFSDREAYALTDVNRLVVDMLTLCKDSLFVPSGIEVACNPDKAVQPIAVKRDALKQVLLNLIKNSVEALGESGKITIATRSNVKVNGKNYLAIVISDNGPGLPKEIRENLFQPVKSTKGEKRGVGLVIVKNLINEMHGGISCKSQEGLGATFQILLPQVEQ